MCILFHSPAETFVLFFWRSRKMKFISHGISSTKLLLAWKQHPSHEESFPLLNSFHRWADMEVPSESFHRSSWDSRTCYPRRAFNQKTTDGSLIPVRCWQRSPFPSWRLHPNTRNQALGTLEATCEAAVRFSLWFASTRSTFQLGQASMSLGIFVDNRGLDWFLMESLLEISKEEGV